MASVRYTYQSECCGHVYIEQRTDTEPMYFPTCNACGNAGYKLVSSETFLAPELVV